jgi:hypothetical protein
MYIAKNYEGVRELKITMTLAFGKASGKIRKLKTLLLLA